jgi:hypothetical protein
VSGPLWYLSAGTWDAPAARGQGDGARQPAPPPPDPRDKGALPPKPQGKGKEPKAPEGKQLPGAGAKGDAPKPPPKIPPGSKAIEIDRPDGEYAILALTQKAALVLTGKVKTLLVGRVDEGSTLDASGLRARQIIFTDRIGGGSTVRLSAPGGEVRFPARVDGGSTLEVEAPGGTVTFSTPSTPDKPGSKIDGNSQVKITAKQVEFRGLITGEATRVVVRLTRGGVLVYREVAGKSVLQYRRDHRADPSPTLRPGRVHAAAKVEYLVD